MLPLTPGSRCGRLASESVERVAEVFVGAFALGNYAGKLVAPFWERAVALDVRVDEREVETFGLGKGECFLEDALPAADVDVARRLFGEGERGWQGVRDLNPIAGERAIARENDGVAIVVEDAFPGLEADAAENDGGAGGLFFKEAPVFGNAPR